jgi:hypothetical protein
MLPEEYHAEACKLLVTWLHRLEERDRRQHGNNTQAATAQGNENPNPGHEDSLTTTPSLSSVPPRQHARAEKKRQRRNAAR